MCDDSEDQQQDEEAHSSDEEELKRRSKKLSDGSYGRVFGLLAEDEDDLGTDDAGPNPHFSFVDTNLDKFNILQFVHDHEIRGTVLSPPKKLINNNENNE